MKRILCAPVRLARRYPGPTGFVVLAVFVFVGFVRTDLVAQENHRLTRDNRILIDRTEKLRRQRIRDLAKSDFEECRRNNGQDRRDRDQDELLLALVRGALNPDGSSIQRELVRAERVLAWRAGHVKPPLNGAHHPVNCDDLPSQRPYRAPRKP